MKKVYGTDDGESPCFFLLEKDMEKSDKNKAKDRARTAGKAWKQIPATFKNRTTASGVTFQGKYVPKQ